MKLRTELILITVLLAAALASLGLSLVYGSVNIGFVDVFRLMREADDSLESSVLFQLRLPRALAAFMTGSMLALSGVLMQVLLRNPLADPYILGISGGSAVAALTAMLTGVTLIWVPQAAFIGALFTVILVFGIAGGKGEGSINKLLLTGIVVSAGWGAVINVLLTTSASNTVQSMLFWLMGDLSQSQFAFWHLAVLLSGLAIAWVLSRSLNVLVRGDLTALTLGVAVARVRIMLYGTAALLTACAVTIAGSVGFVGLIIPHLLRMCGARDHRILIPSAALFGGTFLTFADLLARTVVAPQQLPVGVITALIGVPLFILILRNTSTMKS